MKMSVDQQYYRAVPQLLDVVALFEDVPDHSLRRGQVGTVVEELAPDVFEVEFSNDSGWTYALCALHSNSFIILHYKPTQEYDD